MNKVLIFPLVSCFVFATCKKNRLPNEDTLHFGSATASINTKATTFNKLRADLQNKSNDTISISMQSWDGLIERESISFASILRKTGRYKLYKRILGFVPGINIKPISTYATFWQDGDVLCDYYHVYEGDSLTNNITITAIDSTTKEIRGTFNVTYIRDTLRVKCYPNTEDTIRITNGQFNTKIF